MKDFLRRNDNISCHNRYFSNPSTTEKLHFTLRYSAMHQLLPIRVYNVYVL